MYIAAVGCRGSAAVVTVSPDKSRGVETMFSLRYASQLMEAVAPLKHARPVELQLEL